MRSSKMAVLPKLILVLCVLSFPAWAVVGDLNQDGKVDFSDFFILADNFGRSGLPEAQVADQTTTAIRAAALSSPDLSVSWVDFSSTADLAGWSYASASDWHVANGTLTITGHSSAEITALYFPATFSGEQDISVETTRISGGTAIFGLLFRNGQDGKYCWGLGGSDSYAALRYDPIGRAWSNLVAWTQSSFRATDTNLLRVSIRGTRLEFYVNDQKVGDVTDTHLASGTVGLIVGGTDVVRFDNLVVARPEQPVVQQSTVRDTVEVPRIVRDTVRQVRVDTLRQVVDRVVRDTLRLVHVDTVFANSPTPRPPIRQSWSEVVSEIQPTLYWIGTTQKPRGGQRFDLQLIGTGFAVTGGAIVTNYHVGAGAQDRLKQYSSAAEPVVIAIRAGTRAFEGGTYYLGTLDQSRNLLGLWHPDYDGTVDSPDIAIFTPYNWADGSRATLPGFASLASLDDLFDIGVGDDVGVLGFPGVLETTYDPFSLVPTPTFKSGTISALRPYDSSKPLLSGTQTVLLGKVVQHNLGIAPGNSGSPIFNKRGEVVAIANAGIVGSAAFDFGIRADEIRLLIKASYLAGNLPLPANGKPIATSVPEPQPGAPVKQRR